MLNFWVGTWDRQCSRQKHAGAALSLSLFSNFRAGGWGLWLVLGCPAISLTPELFLRASQVALIVETEGICCSAFVMILSTYLKLIGLITNKIVSGLQVYPASCWWTLPSVTCDIQGCASWSSGLQKEAVRGNPSRVFGHTSVLPQLPRALV